MQVREKTRSLEAVDLEFSDFAPPDTRMAKDAEVFARETHTQDLLSHGYRTYYFGAILASYGRLRYDKELHFAAAVLHDIALTDSRAVRLKHVALPSAAVVRFTTFSYAKGTRLRKPRLSGTQSPPHLNLHLPVREYGEVAALVAKGAVCDLFGFEKRRVSANLKKRPSPRSSGREHA